MIPEPSATPRTSRRNKNTCDETKPPGAVNQSEDELGNENRRRSERKRKIANDGSENVTHKRTRASSRSVRKARSSRRKKEQVEAVTLFDVVSMGKGAMQTVINDWVEAYLRNKDAALLDLICFFIQCSGCKGLVTAEMCQSKEGGDLMSKMVEELDEVAGLQYKRFLAFPWILTVTWPMDAENVEYPLIQSGSYGRWFHADFCDFLSVLVAQCQHSVIFDSYLMNGLISLLAELSDSHIRAYRHTCTLAAVKLLSNLLSVALSLSVGIENSHKLCEVQKRKSTRQKNSPQLEKKLTELQERRAEIESMVDVIFKGVFLKRYRDVLPEIRSLCVEELGLWMKLYSSVFLSDSYLKYIGWMMYDKVADVRLKCVLSLQGLYGDPQLLPKLDLFNTRFKDRIISMTLDKDNEVSVQSMKLLLLISKTSDDVLNPKDYKQLLPFVYCSQRLLASTAGELLFSKISNTVAPASDTQALNKEGDTHEQQALATLKALLQFYLESELHNHVVYLVDSLWDCGGALLKDWSTLTSILLHDGADLTQAEQAVLVEILVASVRQASEGPVLPGRSGAKKVMNAREKKVQMDDCNKLTDHLAVVLPKLLNKFSGSSDIVASLLKIPQYFTPECHGAENTQVASFLLAEMEAVLELHSGPAVLEAAARTYLSLCRDDISWCSSVSRASRDSTVQRWVDRVRTQLQESVKDDSFYADEEQTAEILVTLKKLRTFHNCHDLSQWNLFELLSPLLSLESSQGGAPPQVLQEVLQCLSFSILWSLSRSSEILTSREKAVAQRLQLRLFCERSHRFLSHSDPSVRQQAFLGVCDVLTAHSYQLQVWDPCSFSPLLYTPSPKLQRALLTFVCAHVFVSPDCDGQSRDGESSEEEKLEKLHKRRNVLAAFCKLVVHGVLEMSTAAEVFMYYMKYYNDFGDIIKEMLCRMRQVDKMESSRTLVLSLQQLFMRLKREQDSGRRSNPRVQTFTSIKELARRFALTFGDHVKSRECVVMIHRNGIDFVFQEFSQTPETPTPPYLCYLTILSEFSSKLLKPDKKTVFSYLQKVSAEHVTNLREDRWQPLVYYRASLLAAAEGEDAASHVSSDRRPYVPNRTPSKQKLEGSRSPCPFSPTDSKLSKVSRSSFSPSPQKSTALDPFSPSLEAERIPNVEEPVLSPSSDVGDDDDDVDVEL